MKRQLLMGVLMLTLVPQWGCEAMHEEFQENNPTLVEARQLHEERVQQMTDTAMLHDMSLADFHFVPHTSRLNSLGEQRLTRYAELLKEHGGTLHLATSANDVALTDARLENMRRFLADVGIAEGRIAMQVGMPAGRGMSAKEAIEVKERAFRPDQQGLTDLIGGGSSGQFGVQ